MSVVDTLVERNLAYAVNRFSSELKIIPSLKTLILGCVDPRVDPADILELAPGEAAIIRNVGGRVNGDLFETLDLLNAVAQAAGKPLGTGWNLIVLQHTDCGIIGCYHHAPDLLATYLNVPRSDLDSMAVTDPRAAVALDVAALKAHPSLPGGFMVSGLVYDVGNGQIEVVVPPALLRPEPAH